MAKRLPLTDEEGEVRGLAQADFARAPNDDERALLPGRAAVRPYQYRRPGLVI